MEVLPKPLRRKIFYGMAAVFLVAAPAVVLYSQGYVFDFKSRGLVSTGGIFIKAVQPGAKIFVDSDFQRETSFISRGFLISNLVPRRYVVRVEKDGYQPWQKVLRVSNSEVVEFRNVFLPPASTAPQAIFATRSVDHSALKIVPGRPEIGLEAGAAAKPKTVYLINPLLGAAPLNFPRVSDWFWDQTSQKFFIKRIVDRRIEWHELSAVGGAGEAELRFPGLPSGFSAERITPHPSDPNEFYFLANGALFLRGRAAVPAPIADQLVAYAVSPAHLYFLSKTGFFVETDLDGGEVKVLGRKGLYIADGQPPQIRVSPKGDVIVIDSSGGLFLYQPGRDQELQFISGNVLGVDFSQTGNRMLFWEERRLWLYWLADNAEQPYEVARSRSQIFFSDSPIQSAFLNEKGTYAMYATAAAIRMVEVDNRGSVNNYDLARGKIASMAFDRANFFLYWTDGRTVYRLNLKP